MDCEYILNGKNIGSYKDLVNYIINHNISKDTSDMVFSTGEVTKQTQTHDKLVSLKKNSIAELVAQKNMMDDEPNIKDDNTISTQDFIDSDMFVRGENPIVRKIRSEDYLDNLAQEISNNENIPIEEARAKAELTLKAQQTIGDDGVELHKILDSFQFKSDYTIENFREVCENTKFANISDSLYQSMKDFMYKAVQEHTSTSSENKGRPRKLSNIILKAKLSNYDLDIAGHIDYALIDTYGTVHLYVFKTTTTSRSAWASDKKEKYKYQMALMKQMLANQGFNIKDVSLNIVPVRLKYNDDFTEINKGFVDSIWHIDASDFSKYDSTAKLFISQKSQFESLTPESLKDVDGQLQAIFPQGNINSTGITLTIDDWINQNYNDKVQDGITDSTDPDYAYEVKIGEQVYNISESTKPIKNKELRELLQYHMKYLQENDFDRIMTRLVREIDACFAKSKYTVYDLKTQHPKYGSYLVNVFKKYAVPDHLDSSGSPVFYWHPLHNDLIESANMMLFQNEKTGQIDVVVLSNKALNQTMKLPKGSNVMGSYITDTKAKTLINYKSDYANIEAIRALTVLNAALPSLTGSYKLGQLQVVSIHGSGQGRPYSINHFNQECYQNVLTTTKNNNQDFNYKNNFLEAQSIDSLELALQYYQNEVSINRFGTTQKARLEDMELDNLRDLGSEHAKANRLREIIIEFQNNEEFKGHIRFGNLKEEVEKGNPIATLYSMILSAYLEYSGEYINSGEERLSTLERTVFAANRNPSRTVRIITDNVAQTLDIVAEKVIDEYSPVWNFTQEYYKEIGYNSVRNAVIGDSNHIFQKLYKRNDQNKILMEFKNPYTDKSLNNAEQKYLKKVLYQLTKVRARQRGMKFDFTMDDINTTKYKDFVKSLEWFTDVPLEKASKSTLRQTRNLIKRKYEDMKNYFQGLISTTEDTDQSEQQDSTLNLFDLRNKFMFGERDSDGNGNRNTLLNSKPEGFFETNVENILSDFIEQDILTTELNKTLILAKAIIFQLEMLGDIRGENDKPIIQDTIKEIKDYLKINLYNQSIMDNFGKKLTKWVMPFRSMVTTAYIAGNVTSAFRDTFEGLWQNMMRTVNKYGTNLKSSDVAKGYKEVVQNIFTSSRSVTIINQLQRKYRLSNIDVSRISEGLKTTRSGLFNYEDWLYSTLRRPDFLNRMVLFVSQCIHDGVWDAYSLNKEQQLVYNWKKDKRFYHLANNIKGEEYNKELGLYYNKVREYNQEHSDTPISYDMNNDPLPTPYSNREIREIKNLANNIYGAYDKSMKAKYESMSLGWAFGMWSTWMNGQVSNYFAKPGQYSDSQTSVEQEVDSSGNKRWFDKDGRYCIEKTDENGDTNYYYEDTGELVTDQSMMEPIVKHVPDVVQGIWYSLKQGFDYLKKADMEGFKEEWLKDPVQRKNMGKLLSDLLAMLLFGALFKYALSPAHKEFIKEAKSNPDKYNPALYAIENILYTSSSRSYDGFKGAANIIQYLGENTNPPIYSFQVKLAKDLGKTVFGDKTFSDLILGNVAMFRTFQSTYKTYIKEQNHTN